jgi:RHS repeat-associated protein
VAFGTYAFGRRVYDPSLRRWLSPDPLAAADPEAVTIPELDLWGYAGANPVRNVDRQGEAIETALDVASVGNDVATIASWDANTSTLTKVVDVLALVADVGAAALPGVPGVAGLTVAAARAADKAHDLANVADAAGDAAKVLPDIAEATKRSGKKEINPFKGKSFDEIDKQLTEKGFKKVGRDPMKGEGSYFHPKSGRKYYLDKAGKTYKEGKELPHVDVHRMKGGKNSETNKKKFPLGDQLVEVSKK